MKREYYTKFICNFLYEDFDISLDKKTLDALDKIMPFIERDIEGRMAKRVQAGLDKVYEATEDNKVQDTILDNFAFIEAAIYAYRFK